MAFVITSQCNKSGLCLPVCPSNAIHPLPSDPGYSTSTQLFIDPRLTGCSDCFNCVTACPQGAIYSEWEVPAEYPNAVEENAEWYVEHPDQ